MRTIGAAFLATTLVVSSAYAAAAPLPSGKPAGVKAAQVTQDMGLMLFGAGIVIGGIVFAVSGQDKGVTTPTTTSTSTTGLP